MIAIVSAFAAGVVTAGLANPANGAPANHLCAAATAAVPRMHCAAAPLGVGLSHDKARAQELALFGEAGEARFKLHFGRAASRYAIIETDGAETLGALQEALNKAGFKRTLPWLSRTAYGRALRDATRQSVDAIAAASKLPAAEKAKLLADQLATAERGLSTHEMNLFEATVVPHEIGHGWYTEAFWPGFELDRLGHYGSPSPDWLDETAAILMESGDSAEVRRHHFREAYLGRDQQVTTAELLDLRQFLSRDHPMKSENQAAAAAAAKDGGPTVMVVPDEPSSDPRSGERYYEQGRMFADFLIDRTGNRAVFGAIGRAFGRGLTMDQWLAAEGLTSNLPGNVSELERHWKAWLAARFGKPGLRKK